MPWDLISIAGLIGLIAGIISGAKAVNKKSKYLSSDTDAKAHDSH